MLKSILFIFFLAVLSVDAYAQDISEDIICTTHRAIWNGSAADVLNIKVNPVPESFRQRIEHSGCRNTSIGDLIVWHRKYGSEDTMRAALKYLEDSVKIRGVGIISRGENFKPTPKHRSGDYAVIAKYYLMGARAFPSLDFVKTAERYEVKTRKICEKLSPDWADPTWHSGCRMDRDATVIEKMSREIAVTRALISREKSDFQKAKSIIARAKMPYRDEFVENAFESFDGLCKSGDTKDACAEGYDDEDVRVLLTLQTLLATLENPDSYEGYNQSSYDLYFGLDRMLRVAEADTPHSYTALNQPEFAYQRASLNLAFSDMHFEVALKQAKHKTATANEFDHVIADNIRISFDHLLAAETHTPRYSSPSQWRRIAIKFVDRMEVWNKIDSDIRDQMASSSDRGRQLKYFEDGL